MVIPFMVRNYYSQWSFYFLIGLLGASAIITGLIAYVAFSSGQSHESTVRSALADLAGHTAWSFNRKIERELIHNRLGNVFHVIPACNGCRVHDTPGIHAEPASIKNRIKDDERLNHSWFHDLEISTFFLFEPDSAVLATRSDENEQSTKEFEDWAFEYFSQNSKVADYGINSTLRVTPDGEYRVVVYRIPPRLSGLDVLYFIGYEFSATNLASIFKEIWNYEQLLMADSPDTSLARNYMNISVRTSDGKELYTSGDNNQSTVVKKQAIGNDIEFLEGDISVKPEAEQDLYISGVHTNQLPWLTLLFVLSLIISAFAFLLMRREFDLTRIRSEFIASASHELRTPVTQIRMFSETLKNGRCRNAKEEERALHIINQEATRMSYLISNILDFSRRQRNILELHFEQTDIEQLINQTAEAFGPIAKSGKSRISINSSRVYAETDSSALRQILINILDNAVKYGAEYQTIRINLWQAVDQFHISIEDEGAGITDSIKQQIWKPFWRDQKHFKSAISGSGIGLSVVKQFTDLLNGEITVTSGSQGGARFQLSFPVTQKNK